MSVVFSIRNKKSMFGYQKVMPAKDVLNLVEGVLTYSFEEAMLSRSLKDFPAMLCIRYGKSCLPIILRYLDQEHAYQFILADFATLEDWRLILEWLSALARQLGNEIHDSLGTSYDADSIFSFDYETYLLKNLQNLEKDPDLHQYQLQGFAHPVILDRELLRQILDSPQSLEEFSQVVKKVQYSSAFFSQVRFYRQNETGGIIGSYSLTEDTDTVLPRVPFVPAEFVEKVNMDEVIDWKVNLVEIIGNPDMPESYKPVAAVNLEALLDALDASEFELLDANQIEIKKLSKERLLQLAQLE